jgi:hypothetical protein
MAQRSSTNSSGAFGAGSSSKRERDSESGAEQSASGSKRSRMADAGAVREEREEIQREDGEEVETQQVPDEASQLANELCPITDKNTRPFRLMDMPPEIRIEIYRACLTRPFDVLLSKEPKPVDREKEREEARLRDEEDDDDEIDDDEGDSFENSSLDSDAGVQAFPHGANPLASSAAANTFFNSNHGTARDAEAWVPRRTRSQRSLTRSSPQRSASASASASTNANPLINPVSTWAPAPVANNLVRPTAPVSGPRNNHTSFPPRARRSAFPATTSSAVVPIPPRAPRPQDVDPLLVNLLRASKLIYKESRAILYGENTFLLDLDTAQPTLAALHQRSRGQIKNLRVTIPTHNEILERFAEVVRLSLRYCWRLQRFVIHTPFVLPGAEGSSTSGNTTVYANAFDILRWLPRQCEVVLEGTVCEEIRRVVEKNSTLAKSLDEVSFSSRCYSKDWVQRGKGVREDV